MSKVSVLVTGAGSTMGQSVIKALLDSVYAQDMELYLTNSDNMGAGFYMTDKVSGRYIVPIAKDPTYVDEIIKICKKHKIQVLFSGTEHEVHALSENAERIRQEAGTIVLLSRPEIVELGLDKYKTWQAFSEQGIPFPKTVLFSDYKKLVEECGYPIFMKPRISSASRNIYVIHNEEELFEKKFDQDDRIILQEYLDSDVEYTVGVFCDRKGVFKGAISMRRELQYGASFWGKVDQNEEALAVSRLIAQKLHPEGALNVQLRMVDGRAIPFEVNTRFSSTECVRAHYGFNAVEAAIRTFLFEEELPEMTYRQGMFARYFHECYFDEEKIDNCGG